MSRQIMVALSTMWASRAAGVIANLLLLPVLFRHLPGDALGTWLLLGQAGALLGFLDFGMSNVLMRRVAFTSVPQGSEDPAARAQRLVALMAPAKLLYRGAAVIAVALGLGAGWVFLGRVGLSAELRGAARVAWTLLCLSQAVNLSGGLWSAALAGLGHVAASAAVGSVNGLLTLTALAITALAGGGIQSLALVALAGSLVQRWATLQLVLRKEPSLRALPCRWDRSAADALLVPALKYWVTELGAVLLLRTDQFFIAGFRSPAQIPTYYAGYTLIYNMAMVAMAVGDASVVYVSRLWSEGRADAARILVLRGLRTGLALILSGAAVMFWIGDAVLGVWLGPGHFVGWPVFLTFCAMLALFVQQSLLFGFSRATEHEVYAPCYLAAGALNVLITWALIGPLGLLGVALGTLFAQMLTTNWFVPVTALRRLGIAGDAYLKQAVAPAAAAAVLTCAAVWAATHGIASGHLLVRVATGSAAGAAAMAVGFWAVILDAEMRGQVLRRVRITARRVRWPALS